MDVHLAYLTRWLEQNGASGGEIHRFAEHWRRLGPQQGPLCPACYTDPRYRRKRVPTLQALRLEEGVAMACPSCETQFHATPMRAEAFEGARLAA